MEYFKSLTTTNLAELINSARKNLYLCLPSIHEEIETAITYLDYSNSFDNNDVKIHLLLDFDSQTFRQGYGNFKSVEDLIEGGFEVRCLKDNRISFIISDDVGYYLFIESRTMIPADKETINAVRIDPVSMVRLKKYFFPDAEKSDFKNELANAIIEESKALSEPEKLLPEKPAPVAEISVKEINEVRMNLKQNPPLNPDYKRIVEFYSNKFQYVKLKFEGANLLYRKIEIPSKALPIMDSALKDKLETKLNLFDKADEEECFKPLNGLKAKIAELREKYLKKIKSKDESLLDKLKKSDFEEELETLKKDIDKVKNETINKLASQIELTKKRLLTDLTEFFVANPKALFPDHPNLWAGNESYIKQEVHSKAEEIIYRIKWLKAHLLVDEFKLILQYSDITFEDLKNKDLISELSECKLINDADVHQLAEFGKGVKVN